MSESAGRVVAFAIEYDGNPIHRVFSEHQKASEWKERTMIRCGPVTPLAPEQLLVDCEERLAGYVRLADHAITQRDALKAAVLALADELEADNYGTIRNLDLYAQKLRALTETPSEEKR